MKCRFIVALCYLCGFTYLGNANKVNKSWSGINADQKCSDCISGFSSFIEALKSGASDDELKECLYFYCPAIWLITKDSCVDTVGAYFPTIKYIVEHEPDITAQMICRIRVQDANSCNINIPTDDWSIDLSPGGTSALLPKSYIPKSNQNNLVVLQITDFHYDLDYKIGSDANCLDPVCCRKMNLSAPIKDRAGKWGNYNRCDTPLATIENALEHILKTHKTIDYIYVTGDFVDHATGIDRWSHNFLEISTVMDKLKHAFQNIPIYPLIGNHEPVPTDVYSPPYVKDSNISTAPLYDFLSNEWNWLSVDAKSSIKNGGYYTVLVRPGLRLIAINNNVCIGSNLWLLLNENYMAPPLQWLNEQLFKAEQIGEKVHILAHVPTGDSSCYSKWSHQYNRIVERYRDTISAQFNGHTHRDEFSIHFAEREPFTPINVAWNGGSISTWVSVNPNYRVYYVEPQTYQVIDMETWIFNLTEANSMEHNTPRWFSEYKFKEAYNLTDLSPASLYDFTQKMALNLPMLKEYWQHFVKQGDKALEQGCDELCLNNLLCSIVSTEYNLTNPRCVYLGNLFLNETMKKISTTSKD